MATKKDGVPLLKKGTILNPNKTVDVKMTSRQLDPKTGLLGKQNVKEKSVTRSYKNLLGNPVEKTKRKVVVTGANGKSKYKSTTSQRSFTNPITGVKTEKKVSKETGGPRMVTKTKSNVSTPGKAMPMNPSPVLNNRPATRSSSVAPLKKIPMVASGSTGYVAEAARMSGQKYVSEMNKQEGPQSVAPTPKSPVLNNRPDPRGSVSLQKSIDTSRKNNSDKSNKNSRTIAAGLGAGAAPFKKKTK